MESQHDIFRSNISQKNALTLKKTAGKTARSGNPGVPHGKEKICNLGLCDSSPVQLSGIWRFPKSWGFQIIHL